MAAAILLVALAWPSVRTVLMARMPLHMFVVLPLHALAGAMSLRGLPALLARFARFDSGGAVSGVFASAALAIWMIPSQLDASALLPGQAMVERACWVGAGAALVVGARTWRREVMLFLAGNAAWMMATAGLLYQQMEARLCASYTRDDQSLAGEGLVAAGILLGASACAAAIRSRRPEGPTGPGRKE